MSPPCLTPEIADLLARKGFELANEKALKELELSLTPWQQGVTDCYNFLVQEDLLKF